MHYIYENILTVLFCCYLAVSCHITIPDSHINDKHSFYDAFLHLQRVSLMTSRNKFPKVTFEKAIRPVHAYALVEALLEAAKEEPLTEPQSIVAVQGQTLPRTFLEKLSSRASITLTLDIFYRQVRDFLCNKDEMAFFGKHRVGCHRLDQKILLFLPELDPADHADAGAVEGQMQILACFRGVA